jgi:hypothetical protein
MRRDVGFSLIMFVHRMDGSLVNSTQAAVTVKLEVFSAYVDYGVIAMLRIEMDATGLLYLFFDKALLMELPKRHATSLQVHGQPARTHQ